MNYDSVYFNICIPLFFSPSDTTATVNIPIKDGVISLRPTRLDAVHPDFIESIDAETWSQIKELQSNLNKLVKSVDGKI